MIINDKIIKNIFNLKLKLTDENDKKELAKYTKLIPMYDIYSNKLYLVKNTDLFKKLLTDNYRFVGTKVRDWFIISYDKATTAKIKSEYKTMLEILENYDLNELIDTTYKTLTRYSPELSISICKRNSFNRYSLHIDPYYSKIELVKLAKNMGLKITKKDEKSMLLRSTIETCRLVSNNDIANTEIVLHSKHIINKDIISWVTFYSFYGSFLLNTYLRNNEHINKFLYEGLKQIVNGIKSSPSLKNKYYIYRFVHDDSFLKKLKVNDVYIDNGFLSTTRDPFYKPSTEGIFGLILIKIYIPMKEGMCLLMENFSLFPKEQELLLPPNTKLKLIAKDDKFKYYHINSEFEKKIVKKYEFKIVNINYKKYLENIKIGELNYKVIQDIKKYSIEGSNRLTLIQKFIEGNDIIKIKMKNKEYSFLFAWFDSITSNIYSKFYFNKIKDGIVFSLYENGYPYLNIEIGNYMVINYINKYYYYKDKKTELNNDLLELILEFGRIFDFKKIFIFHNYRNFSEFNTQIEFQYYNHFYNHTIYNFLKFKKKYLDLDFIDYSWTKLKKILNTKMKEEIINKYFLNQNIKFDTIGDGYLYLIQSENFHLGNQFLIDNEVSDNDMFLVYNVDSKLKHSDRFVNRVRITNYEDRTGFNSSFKLTDSSIVFERVV